MFIESAKRWVNAKIDAIPDQAKREEYKSLSKNDYAEIVRRMQVSRHIKPEEAEKLISLVCKFKSLRRNSARKADLEEMKHLARELNLPS